MKSETVVTVDDLPADVIEAIKSGRKIEAIKFLRMETGLGLANAKVLVEAAARQYGIAPSHPAMLSEHGGSASLIRILLLMLVGAGIWFYLK